MGNSHGIPIAVSWWEARIQVKHVESVLVPVWSDDSSLWPAGWRSRWKKHDCTSIIDVNAYLTFRFFEMIGQLPHHEPVQSLMCHERWVRKSVRVVKYIYTYVQDERNVQAMQSCVCVHRTVKIKQA